MPIHWLSILLVAILGFTTYRAYRSGFVRELVSLASVILAVPIAGLFYNNLYPKVDPIVDNTVAAALISFLALLLGVIIAGQVGAHLLRHSVAMLNLGGADQLAGAAFGLLKGLLFCQVILVALVVFPNPDLRRHIDDSSVARVLVDGSTMVLSLLPGGFGDGVNHFLEGRYPGDEGEPPGSPAAHLPIPSGDQAEAWIRRGPYEY
jgi:membrane protein required for colicin V production